MIDHFYPLELIQSDLRSNENQISSGTPIRSGATRTARSTPCSGSTIARQPVTLECAVHSSRPVRARHSIAPWGTCTTSSAINSRKIDRQIEPIGRCE